MSKGAIIDADKVREIKGYLGKYPTMQQKDLAKMCGVSSDTVRRVRNGEYDGVEAAEGLADEVLARISEQLDELTATLTVICDRSAAILAEMEASGDSERLPL